MSLSEIFVSLQVLMLFALLFVVQLVGGAMAWTAVHNFTGGRWFAPLKPFINRWGRRWWLPALLLFSIVGVSILFKGEVSLYPWSENLDLMKHPHWVHKQEYFSLRWRLSRVMLYAVVLWACSVALLTPRASRWLKGFFTFALTTVVAFIGIDFVMSVNIEWHSTIFGAHFALKSLNLALISFFLASKDSLFLDKRTKKDLGNLLLVVTMLWAYFHVSQFLIIWSAQIPYEENWYKARAGRAELMALGCMIMFGFVLPFFLLLWRKLKSGKWGLYSICMSLLFAHLIEYIWLILPSLPTQLNLYPWMILTAALLGGLAFLRRRRDATT